MIAKNKETRSVGSFDTLFFYRSLRSILFIAVKRCHAEVEDIEYGNIHVRTLPPSNSNFHSKRSNNLQINRDKWTAIDIFSHFRNNEEERGNSEVILIEVVKYG